MNAENRCPACNAELAANAPRGLCPACLLKGGLGTQTGGTGGSNPSQSADFVLPTPADLAPHFPNLEILELVGRGGMGIVYKARQKDLDRLVALKVLSPKIGQDPAFADRFTREARAMAMLSHPHVVTVYDFGKISSSLAPSGSGAASEDGLYYFFMEFVDGLNLRQLLDFGKLAPEEALAIVPQICDALQYAHDAGVVHRDIKPENILLDKAGRVKIADFGLAKLMRRAQTEAGEGDAVSVTADVSPCSSTLTAVGQVMGTPNYMAPEQFEHPKDVDRRADIYSLGVVFYQMLTGELPIGRFAPPSKKVQIDVRLDEVVLRALEQEPEHRYQQASEIKTRLESIVTTPLASSASAGQISASSTAPKVSMCYLSTPEHLRTFRGRFLYIYQGKGELRLDDESLSFRSGWAAVEIPVSSIRKIAQGAYPYSAKPAPIHFIEVTFTEHGVERTLLFTPVLQEVMFPQEANKVVAEWLSALLETIQVGTGRTLSVGESEVAQDKLWFAKTVLLVAAQVTVICSIIPAVLLHRMPSLLTVLLLGPISAIVMTAMFLAMRWWQRRSAITSGDLDSLTMRAIGSADVLLSDDAVHSDTAPPSPGKASGTHDSAAGTTADKATWQSPDSGWGWLIGKMFGITFTSRLAYRCANLSALGFLGFLGFMPVPGWHGCFGFFGLFGLIGVAHVIEAFARPSLTAGKWLAIVTATAMAIGMLVSFFLAYLSTALSR